MATSRLCSVVDCGKRHKAFGYCDMHLVRFHRHGDPLGGGVFRRKSRAGTCEVAGCRATIKRGARGMCRDHYLRWRAHGDPTAGRTRRGALLAWLRQHATWAGFGCLKWPFYTGKDGYGFVRIDGVGMRASRAMCIVAHGKPPTPKHEAAHSCGKGGDACVHPQHLRWATPGQNAGDKRRHGTLRNGERARAARLTATLVRNIRAESRRQSHAAIGKKYGVTRATVGDIINRRTWKHI